MISAAGDGQQSFETFAQALALAREVAGIEIVSLDPDLEALRPPPKPDEAAKRKLRRKGMQVPTATAGFVTATFRYLGEDGKPLAMIGDDGQPDEDATCTLHIVEAALLGDLPWDLHAYAEANEDFPDISTGYQYMDHRDFEAYRMLGWVQAGRALQKAGELEDVELEGRTTPSAPPQVPTLPAHPIRVWRWWEQRHNEG